jgi:hypothetical protein
MNPFPLSRQRLGCLKKVLSRFFKSFFVIHFCGPELLVFEEISKLIPPYAFVIAAIFVPQKIVSSVLKKQNNKEGLYHFVNNSFPNHPPQRRKTWGKSGKLFPLCIAARL